MTNMSKSTTAQFSVSPVFVVFVVLKLTGVITWSWWWVTSPLWIPILLVLGFFLCWGVTVLIAMGFTFREERKRERSYRF